MKISQWLGYNEDASQYLLRPGELRVLNNLQPRRPGMLIARTGVNKIFGQYNDEALYGIYRRATILGNPSDFLWLKKVLMQRELTAAQIAADENPLEFKWMVMRVEGNQFRVIDTQPLKPGGATAITHFCVAEDRHGRMFIFYGNGARPKLYRPGSIGNVAVDMGIDAPLLAPSVSASGTGYFVEGVDVQFGGGSYYEPPEITLSGGNPLRPAKLKAIVQSGNVVGATVVDGGAGYESPPTITVAADKIGVGFRARGNVSASARTIDGFPESKAPTTVGTAPTSTQTYGTTNGTADNRIMYLTRPTVATTTLVSAAGAVLTLDSVNGIAAGDVVTAYPSQSPFSAGNVTVSSVNASNNTVTISSGAFSPIAGNVYELTFSRNSPEASAPAEYDAARRRFVANVPLATTAASGKGAYATLEFSPRPLGFGLNAADTSSIALTNTFRTYLYGEYWEGSDFDVAGSAENARYGGLQASGSRYVLGFSGNVNGRAADVYWPDYSAISVWLCTGIYSSNLNQWTRFDVPVLTEQPSGARYVEFQLRPTAAARTVQSLGGSAIATEYEQYEQLPSALAPTVKIYLTSSPDSWVTTGDQCLPTSVKEANATRLAWWTPGTAVTRPFVNISPEGTPISASTILITNPGRGWQQNTLFAFRIYQANPYDQFTDFNTATSEPSIARSHPRANTFVEYRLTANAPDNATPHGPPNALTSALVTIPGSGYASGTVGSLTLLRRELTAGTASATAAQTLSWTSAVLNELSSSTTGQIASVTILSKGRNYFSPPTLEVRGGGTGYGLRVEPTVANGRVESVQIIDPGMSYTTPPELFTTARAAELTPVMRPTMRGKYRCAYRFVDRSETVVKTVTATLGESATTLTLSDTAGIEPEMIIEAAQLPNNLKIQSVNGNQIQVTQQVTGIAAGASITAIIRDLSKPIAYSDLSPITDVDAGPNESRTHASELVWSLAGIRPPARADRVELWRTSADQSLVFYRLETYGVPSESSVTLVGRDTLTDEELFDSSRPHYAAMPVVLPNGNVNAYRFGKPRSDMSVAVAFQDRLWMGVSTSGEGANTLYYSEFDEFESTPDVNELPIQNNQKSTDVLTALVPFGSMLLAMQHTHTYSVTYNTDPAIDGAIQMMSHRGCLHQRCWDIHENVLYAADESGIYAMSRNGEVKDVSLPIRDFFVSEIIDFSKRDTFFLQTDPRTHILRFFCVLKTNPTDTPSVALCFDIQAGTWWTESYPNSFTAACTGRPSAARINTMLLGAVDGNLYELAGDSDHANDTLTDTFIVENGSGYYEAPQITVPNCNGAVVKGVVSEGRLVDVIIQSSGWGARGGLLLAAEDGRLLATHNSRPLGGEEYWPIKLNIASPEPGGVQAVAYANFSITPRIVRECTVSQGESFVRLDMARTQQVQRLTNPPLAAETGATLFTQNSRPITTEPPPVEVGMEAIGEFIPMNAFVSRLDGRDVYLEHPDGTPVSLMHGAPRTNAPNTSEDFLENGGTFMTVTFRKPYKTHIPFRMATGFMQLANEENTRNGDRLMDRSVTVVYTPTDKDKEVELIERFNGQEEMRPNAMRRSQTGANVLANRQDSASTVLNTSKAASPLGASTGVAKARFASRVYTDMTAADQHLQVELYARPIQASPWNRTNFWIPSPSTPVPQPFVLHSLTVDGVVADG